MNKVKILGIGYDKNSSYLRGAANSPDYIRKMHYDGSANAYCERGNLIDFGNQLEDCGNLSFNEDASPAEVFQHIKNIVGQQIADETKLISLGGDHSIAYPTIAAHAEKYGPLHILQIDAHGDLYENFENNPYSHASPFARLFENGHLASLTQIGIRSLNTHQREQIKKFHVNTIEMKDHNEDFISKLKGPLYITLDLDGLDPAHAPGVSHHEPGGLTTRQVLNVIHKINIPIIGAEIVELNPERDVHNMTAMLAYKLMKEIASKMLYE